MTEGIRLALEAASVRYGATTALDSVDLEVPPGEFLVVRGKSGSGKTTTLLTLGGMLRPTSGRVLVDGRDLYAGAASTREAHRARDVGFVFQTFHLLPYLDVADNLRLATPGRRPGRGDAVRFLDELGLGHRATHRPDQLSAGERQRAAVLRALFARPRAVLADEPTGNLDAENARAVIDLLMHFHRDGGTVVLVTHGALGDDHADRVLHLDSGRLAAATGAPIAP